MPDVCTGHEVALFANLGDTISLVRPGIDRHVFPDDASRPQPEPARTTGISGDLPGLPDRCERENLGALADLGVSLDDDVLMQTNAGSEHDLRPYDAIGTDSHVGSDFALNLGRGMDFGHKDLLSGVRLPVRFPSFGIAGADLGSSRLSRRQAIVATLIERHTADHGRKAWPNCGRSLSTSKCSIAAGKNIVRAYSRSASNAGVTPPDWRV